MIHGADLGAIREQAKNQVMYAFVSKAEADGTPATLRALYVLKAQQAELVVAGGNSLLIEREAELRGVSVKAMAETIVSMARQSEALEIARMETNVAIERATDESEIVEVLKGIGLTLSMP